MQAFEGHGGYTSHLGPLKILFFYFEFKFMETFFKQLVVFKASPSSRCPSDMHRFLQLKAVSPISQKL